jgi:WD40 repeat protein
MNIRHGLSATVVCLLSAALAHARADQVLLRPEPGGPMGVVNAVAFSPDGERIYAAGYDKVVRVWSLTATGDFELSKKVAYRVPIAPGAAGTINALATSSDGRWLAAGGLGVMQGQADFRTVGMVVPAAGALTDDQLLDQGTIYVFDVNNPRAVKVLRKQAGTVLALTFLPSRAGEAPLLVSAALEPTGKPRPNDYAARVRLWDVAREASLADAVVDVDAESLNKTPGLAAWHTGKGATDAVVAVAWSDGKARVWDAADGKVRAAADQKINNTAAVLEPGKFLTAGFTSPNGVVRSWGAEAGKGPQLLPDVEARLPPEDPKVGPFFLPRDLAVLPSRAGGPMDRAVVVARRKGINSSPDDDDVLMLLDLANNKVLGKSSLGAFQYNVRRVAASPTGAHVAVADADRERVLVYATADLAAGKARPRELRSVGVSFQAVEFRKNGDDVGLFLEDDAGVKMVFDFSNRRLLPDNPAWAPDAPDVRKWEVRHDPKRDPGQLAVSGPDFKTRTVALGPNCKIKAFALLPPAKGGPFGPLLAVGWLDKFEQPMLALYDVQSGVQVRQLAGHIAAVGALAFSGDGRLLASAAADQTVCLWSMTSLDQVIDKAGALPGVRLVQKGKAVEVAEAPDDSPLKEGAVLEGVVEGEKLRELTTPAEFYTAFFETKPQEKVVLRVRPPGAAKAADVKVTAGQGTDEHKPLLSLFVTRDGAPARREWIAWTSLGPYDASSRRAEDYLGWHFNPEKRTDPVDFARADKYRAAYESPGILKYVIRDADASRALDHWKDQPPPKVRASIDGVDPDAGPRVGDRPLVRAQALMLRAEVPEPFPADRVSAVRWSLDGGAWQDFGPPRGREYAADLASKPPWGRGKHEVVVRLEADGGRRQSDQLLAFYYLPERPHIKFAKPWLAKYFPAAAGDRLEADVKQADFEIDVDVSSGTPGEDVAGVIRRGKDEVKVVNGAPAKFTLDEGESVFEVRAVNQRALNGLEAEETATRTLVVRYFKERAAPRVTLREVTPQGGAPIRVPGGGRVEVAAPKVRVVGQVVAADKDDNLEEVTRDGKPVAGFTAGQAPQFDINEIIALEPGKETAVSYKARTKKSAAGEGAVRLVYVPPTAGILSVRPLDPAKVYDKEVEVEAKLDPPAEKQTYTAEVLVNGASRVKKDLDEMSREFKAKVALEPGANRVVVSLRNAWGATAAREVQVRWLRPPRVVKFDPPKEVDRAVLDLSAEVESPPELPPCEAKLNAAPFRDARFKAELLDRNKGLWKVTLLDVALKNEGKNSLELFVANTDDDSREAATAEVKYTKPKQPAPVVKFRDFRGGGHYDVPAPRLPLAFTVESETPLSRVELRGENDAVVFSAALKPGDRKAEGAPEVRLRPATPTRFRLVAVNAGDEAETDVTLQTPDRPAYVVIDRLEAPGPNGKPQIFLPASDLNDGQGRVVFAEVSGGRVVLHGRILWNDPKDERFQKKINLRVYANDFQQLPAEAQPPKDGAAECEFQAPVLLTRAADNLIEVDLPGLADGPRSACVVRRCTDPVRRRLRLVIVGVGEKDGDGLKQRALKAVGAAPAPGGDGRLQAPPAFEDVVADEPLVKNVTKGKILYRLKEVKRQIQATAADGQAGGLAEVVLVYYQGREMVAPGGHYLLTDDFESDEDLTRTGVSCAEIVGEFADARGAQVVMLDVERVARDPADRDAAPTDRAFAGARLGVFLSFWSGNPAPATRLLPLLQKGWSESVSLGDLANQVDLLRQKAAPKLQFAKYLPEALAQLEFGGKQ